MSLAAALVLCSSLFASSPRKALADVLVDVTGTASAVNTGGSIYFDAGVYSSNVKINDTTHLFSGYAWSNDLGWVDFGTIDNPDGPVSLDPETGLLSGKARVVSTGANIIFDALPYGSNVRVVSAGTMSGYAWSTDIGWINFSGVSAVGAALTPPEAPKNMRIFDVSDRALADYAILVRWQQPDVFNPAAFETYLVERSTDNVTFVQVASTTSKAYYDTNVVTGTTYYYRTKTKYLTGTTFVSATVSLEPTGKWTTPPNLISGPTATINPTSLAVTWVTDRNCTSFVRIKEGGVVITEQGQSESVTSHSVKVVGLRAQHSYEYSIKSVDEDGNALEGAYLPITTTNSAVIYDLIVTNLSLNSAILNFKSSEIANFTLYYGESANFGSSISEQSGSKTTNHSIALTGLKPGTMYFYRLSGEDAESNEIRSENSFSTLPMPTISALVIRPVAGRASSTLNISWVTNVPTTSIVKYRSANVATIEKSTSDLVAAHEIEISDLADQSVYTIDVSGSDQFGNLASSLGQTYTTPVDTRPPTISAVVIETSNVGLGQKDSAQIAVSWKTDEPTTSQVEYDTGISGAQYTKKTAEDATLTNSHLVIVSGLTPGQPYHIRAVSKDRAGNAAYSSDNTIISGEVSKSTLQIILKVLNSTFGWIGKLFQ